jgi:long-chain fatty acid transport protein
MNRGKQKARILAAAVAAAIVPAVSGATDGYFAHGYGMKSLGMGGASIARTDDAYGGANNPAQFAFAADQFDVGVSWFSPTRSAERTGSAAAPLLNGSANSGSTSFFVPEMGYVTHFGRDFGAGVTVYGNGGMNTDYGTGQIQCQSLQTGQPYSANMLCGTTGLGIDLSQLIIAPTVAWKVGNRQSLGLSPLIVEQRFKATGLQTFAGFQFPNGAFYSSDPSSVTDNGYAYSHGIGLRLGYLMQVSPDFSFGLSYALKTSMSKFDKYKGLFAGQGNFDIPENYGIGMNFRPGGGWTVALDYTRILYSKIPSVGNPSSNQAQLGMDNGPGFGWKDVNAIKLGAEYAAAPGIVVRGGYNHSSNPIGSQDVTFNILAPGVVQDHFTLGGTWSLDKASEISFAFAYMPTKSVSGSSAFGPLLNAATGGQFPANGGGTETIKLGEKLLGVSWAMKL